MAFHVDGTEGVDTVFAVQSCTFQGRLRQKRCVYATDRMRWVRVLSARRNDVYKLLLIFVISHSTLNRYTNSIQ
jgi:hypothetical protein